MEQYGGEIIQDLSKYINDGVGGPTQFQVIPPTSDIYSDHRQQYQMGFPQPAMNHDDALILPQTLRNQLHQDFRSDVSNTVHVGADLTPAELDIPGEDSGSGSRWPRQETLTLLEIRSSLDSKFKEANSKSPLWDQVSRIMASEHGYCRNGKKCKEKFENLYKYYKKTKDGKVGKQQQGHNYRFFRQLESIFGETDQLIHQEIQSKKSSYKHDDDLYGGRRGWKVKMKSLIDLQVRKLMEKQEEWLENVLKIIERKEQERVLKEDEWRMQEATRVEKEFEFRAKERAWIEARDVAIMDVIRKLAPQEKDQMISINNKKHVKALARRSTKKIREIL
ncbi:trihelix transcription factor PTL-like [Impatiens glandulifera]|uniref:trihelix transcription factor PTL-like n=1 Tax=Impatiens glandulifera TaxID=253017 RepID=UPI001FB18288|nr:trihelix transcription factor PTL-like [Impatiens glandulifera]